MKLVLPIAALLLTTLSTLTAVVFCLGMGANASAAQLRMLKLWMAGFSLLGVVGVVGAILLLRKGHEGWATGVAFFPTAFIAVVFLVVMLK